VFEAATIDAEACRRNAMRFSEPRFRAEFERHFTALVAAGARRPLASDRR
jgi:hypothetical protein